MINLLKENNKFPDLLKEIYGCPKNLYCLGDIKLLKRKMVAVVGSRKMSQYGFEVVHKIIPELVKNDYVIVSGMALGIDAEAQNVCLDNDGKTIAVLASGVDVVSPRSNLWLYDKILSRKGLIISEYINGTTPNSLKFLERNRIISGLSLAVIVIEGGNQSGTLVTAKYAIEQGKDVWCVPGRITDKNSFTPNFLIKNGAKIISSLDDIKEYF